MSKPVKKHAKRNLYWSSKPLRFPEIFTPQPTKGCNLPDEPDAVTLKVRAEIERRTKRLHKARVRMGIPDQRFKPIKRGGKVVGWKEIYKITPEQAAELHSLAFTAEQVRAEVESNG